MGFHSFKNKNRILLAALIVLALAVSSVQLHLGGLPIALGPFAATSPKDNPFRERPAGASVTFETLPPGSALPSGDDCAARVGRGGWEPRPENATANETIEPARVPIDGGDERAQQLLAPRIDGNFTGTTDEIIQWSACKWGFNEDQVRAQVAQESWWRQDAVGDYTTRVTLCASMGLEAPCYQSVGLLQVKGSVHDGTYPAASNSTAFNVDYALAWRRACFEGSFSAWVLAEARGDEWGCTGLWFSGRWNDSGARDYVARVRRNLESRVWDQPAFGSIAEAR